MQAVSDPARHGSTSAWWRFLATGTGWLAAVLLAVPVGLIVAGVALTLGATGHQIVGNDAIGVVVVVFGVHLPAGLIAAITMPKTWHRFAGHRPSAHQALRVTLPTMIVVGAVEATKATLSPIGYLSLTLLQVLVILGPLTARGFSIARPQT